MEAVSKSHDSIENIKCVTVGEQITILNNNQAK